MEKDLTIVVCVAENNAIGNKGDLIYHISNDLKHFKELTTGGTVIMGRKTFESLPNGALPNRRNIVLTRSKSTFENAETFGSLDEALEHCKNENVFVIGGASVYREALDIAEKIEMTLVHDTPEEADTFFPSVNVLEWTETNRVHPDQGDGSKYDYEFITYVRK